MGPRAGLDRCAKSRPYGDSIPGPSESVASSYTGPKYWPVRPDFYGFHRSETLGTFHLTGTDGTSSTRSGGSLMLTILANRH